MVDAATGGAPLVYANRKTVRAVFRREAPLHHFEQPVRVDDFVLGQFKEGHDVTLRHDLDVASSGREVVEPGETTPIGFGDLIR